MNELLEVENVSVRYGALEAVRNVSLSLAAGETLGLVGESGCGKSSLGRAVLALEPAASGRVLFEGSCVHELRGASLKQFRCEAQMVFQDPFGSLNPRMSVGAAIEEVLYVHGLGKTKAVRRERAAELFENVGLNPDWLRRYPHEFSGGQRQRIGIARALAVEPKLLVADEPVSALDVSVQADIVRLLKKLQHERGLAYLFVGHDLAVVRDMSDRIAVMFNGEIVETGSADQVCDGPQHPYTQKLLSAVPDIDTALAL
ncbi:ATP-binding cassette domain-containing protein [Tichowtungia aerotolerans]|uniref:ATP-binding cassette domain-containing protein n=1 Tax=Tichowtungia aerotolerans TaxID=2697043 RepID=A0A6P1MAU6_9BACT|nr:ATP-binding cassette domain-containing protein [Tichowtungia aerotolerans]QHI69674.1 ATP-binding cassette domain-containing protein [Tichowtungia aerotolerans]